MVGVGTEKNLCQICIASMTANWVSCVWEYLFKYVKMGIDRNTKGPLTHSNENVIIEASSTFHRSFIEFFVVMHEVIDEKIVQYHEKFDEICTSQT